MNGPAGHVLLWLLLFCAIYEIVRFIRDRYRHVGRAPIWGQARSTSRPAPASAKNDLERAAARVAPLNDPATGVSGTAPHRVGAPRQPQKRDRAIPGR